MSIVVSDLTYRYPNQSPLFDHLSFSVARQEKVSVVGDNGVGKSTLLKLIAGVLQPVEGSIVSASPPHYIPQHTGLLNCSVAEAMGVDDKLAALEAVAGGSLSQSDYDTLADDWDIESRCLSALSYWGLSRITPDMPMDLLSGGEQTKVFLSGLILHQPEIILMDEPSNHMDNVGREQLYRYIEQTSATIVVVSHDVALLDRIASTYELSAQGMKSYGGNYAFYREQKEIEKNALHTDIDLQEKQLRDARRKAREISQRQEKRANRGGKEKLRGSNAPILVNARANSSENTASRLKGVHNEIIGNSTEKLSKLKQQRGAYGELKINFDNTSLHPGRLLVEAKQINFSCGTAGELWKSPVDIRLLSNDRVRILGNNGTGKTTLLRLLSGALAPSSGEIIRSEFTTIYLDQNYTQMDVDRTVMELAGEYNLRNLQEHEIRLRLNRFMFPTESLDKKCNLLSGGERMKLYLCLLTIANQTPDMIILDEPTNNLDVSSLEILAGTLRDYKGCLLVVSHDEHFISGIGIEKEQTLG